MGVMSKDGTLPNVKIISSETVHTDMWKYVEMLSVCLHAVTKSLVKRPMGSKPEWQSPIDMRG